MGGDGGEDSAFYENFLMGTVSKGHGCSVGVVDGENESANTQVCKVRREFTTKVCSIHLFWVLRLPLSHTVARCCHQVGKKW